MTALSSAIVIIDSNERTAGPIESAQYSLLNVGGVKGTYEVMDFQSFNSVYNVDASNNQLQWDDDDAKGPYTAVIPSGNYTLTTLLTVVKDLMDTVGTDPVFTFTEDPNTGIITTNVQALEVFNWEFGTIPLNGANILLGLEPENTIPALSYTGTLVPNLRTHTHILVRIEQEGNKNPTRLDGTEYSALVPLEGYGQAISGRKLVNFTQQVFFESNLSNMTVSLFTEDGNVLQNAQRYVLSIRRLF